MGMCFTRGDTELKASFGMGNEYYYKEASGEFDKKYFEIPMNCNDKFQVYEGMNLIFLYWYRMHLALEKKRQDEQNEFQTETVSNPLIFET